MGGIGVQLQSLLAIFGKTWIMNNPWMNTAWTIWCGMRLKLSQGKTCFFGYLVWNLGSYTVLRIH